VFEDVARLALRRASLVSRFTINPEEDPMAKKAKKAKKATKKKAKKAAKKK